MKNVFIIVALFLCLQLCGCTVLYGELFVEISDQNGDDISLTVLTDVDICAEIPEYYCFECSIYPYSDVEEIEGDFFEIEDTINACANSSFSGVGSIQSTFGKTEVIVWNVTSKLESGNLRIVLVDLETKRIIYDFKINEEDQFVLNNAIEGKYEIRVAGESAEFSITVSRSYK